MGEGVDPVMVVTAAHASLAGRYQRRIDGAAGLIRQAAARCEDAAGGDGAGGWREPGDGVERSGALAQAGPRQAAQQAGRIGVVRIAKQGSDRAFLHEAAGIEHADPIAQPGDGTEIVADEQDGGAELAPQRVDEIEYLGFDGGVEAGRRLVEDEQRGSLASAMAITTRCCMPPDNWCG